MAKKRKTRQEKIVSDLRRQLQIQQPEQTTVTSTAYFLPTAKAAAVTTMNHEPKTQNTSAAYSYVLSDLKKTLVLTAVAIAAQIALHFILRT